MDQLALNDVVDGDLVNELKDAQVAIVLAAVLDGHAEDGAVTEDAALVHGLVK